MTEYFGKHITSIYSIYATMGPIYCRLKWLNDHTLLTATAQGNLNAFDARTGNLKFTLTGHFYHIYEFAYKCQENLLLTVSEDTTAKIFKIPPLGE